MLDILNYITDNGYEAYYVGGYPRDLYLGYDTNDYDICTNALPTDIARLFKADMTYADLGVVKVEYHNRYYDVTTYRIEAGFMDMRKPNKILFTNSLEQDLKRRDFTINALCIDRNGQYYDLLGAKSDLDHKVIRMIGDPNIRLKEDALRILRAIRFATKYSFTIEPELMKAILKYKDNLKYLSKTKKQMEIAKMNQAGLEMLNKLEIR